MLCRFSDKYSAEKVGVVLLEERSDDDIFYNGRETCELSASDYENLTNTELKKVRIDILGQKKTTVIQSNTACNDKTNIEV